MYMYIYIYLHIHIHIHIYIYVGAQDPEAVKRFLRIVVDQQVPFAAGSASLGRSPLFSRALAFRWPCNGLAEMGHQKRQLFETHSTVTETGTCLSRNPGIPDSTHADWACEPPSKPRTKSRGAALGATQRDPTLRNHIQ